MAGVALGDIDVCFTQQAWHNLTSTFVLLGRRGTHGTVGDIDVRLTWQAWRNLTSTFVLRGRCGTYGTGWRAWAGFSMF